MTKLKRSLYGYGPLPSDRLTTQIEIPEYLWPVAMALAEAVPCPTGHHDMTEAKARALATTMGCVLPPEHCWCIGEPPQRSQSERATHYHNHHIAAFSPNDAINKAKRLLGWERADDSLTAARYCPHGFAARMACSECWREATGAGEPRPVYHDGRLVERWECADDCAHPSHNHR